MDKVPIPEKVLTPVLNVTNKGVDLWTRLPEARVAILIILVYLMGYFQFNLALVSIVGVSLYMTHISSFEREKAALKHDLVQLNETPQLLKHVLLHSESLSVSPSAAGGQPSHLSSDHIASDFNEEKKEAKRRVLEMALDDELDLIRLRRKLARRIGVPNWIKFNGDRESVHWLNNFLTLLWYPWMKESIEKAIRESLDPVLAENCPSFLSGIQMGVVDLGCGIDACRVIDEYCSIADLSGTSGDEDSMADDEDDDEDGAVKTGSQPGNHDSGDDDADLIDDRLLAQVKQEDKKHRGRRGSLTGMVGAVGGGVSSGVRSSINIAKTSTHKVTSTVGKVANSAVGSLTAKKRRDLRRRRRRKRRAGQMTAGGLDHSIMTKRCALVIESARVYSLVRHKEKDQVILDLDIMFGKRHDTHISIDVKSKVGVTMTATLDNIELSGTLRVTFTDFVDFLPCFSKVKLCFITTPHLSYDLGALKIPLSSIPGLKGWLQDTIDGAIESAMVYPVELEIPLFDDPNAQPTDADTKANEALSTPTKKLSKSEKKRLRQLEIRKKAITGRNGEKQEGFLNVKILECRNLAKKDTFSDSDPLCLLWIEHVVYPNDAVKYFDQQVYAAYDRGSDTSGSESDGTPRRTKRKRSLFRSSKQTSFTEEEAAAFDTDVGKMYAQNPEVNSPSRKQAAAKAAAASIDSGLESNPLGPPTLRSDKFSPCSLGESYVYENTGKIPFPQPVPTPIMKERTITIEDNCNPEWDDANFYWLRVFDHTNAVLAIDVQNARYAAANDELGKLRVPLAKCLPRSLSLVGTPVPFNNDGDASSLSSTTEMSSPDGSNSSPGIQAPWFEGWFDLQCAPEEKKKRRLSLSFRSKKSKRDTRPRIKLRIQYVPIDYGCDEKLGDEMHLKNSDIGFMPRSQTVSGVTGITGKNQTMNDPSLERTAQSVPRSQTMMMTGSSSDQSFVKVPSASKITMNDTEVVQNSPKKTGSSTVASDETAMSDASLFGIEGGSGDSGDSISAAIASVTSDDASSASGTSTKSWMDKEDIMLTVKVIQARDLISADRGGTSDPYAILKMKFANPKELSSSVDGRKSEVQTEVVKKNCSPVWNESFSFRLTQTDKNSSLATVMLKVRVKDHDKYTVDSKLGAIDISLTQLLGLAMAGAGKSEPQWFDLENVKSGQIQLQISLSRV